MWWVWGWFDASHACLSEDPLHPMFNDPKRFCKYSISHTSVSLKVYGFCIPSKKQEQLNCKFIPEFQWKHILCWKMGSRCKRSVFWVNWVILTAIYRFWNWRNRPVFTFVTNPRKFYIFLLKICQDLAGKYIAQVSFARWRSSDKQLGPRTVNLVLIPARRCYTRILVHASHSWLIYIHFVTGTARKMKAILFSKHRRGPTYTCGYMAKAQSVGIA